MFWKRRELCLSWDGKGVASGGLPGLQQGGAGLALCALDSGKGGVLPTPTGARWGRFQITRSQTRNLSYART